MWYYSGVHYNQANYIALKQERMTFNLEAIDSTTANNSWSQSNALYDSRDALNYCSLQPNEKYIYVHMQDMHSSLP